jgi:hypothetical protein
VVYSVAALVLQIAGVAAIASWLWRQYFSDRDVVALVLGIAGALVLYDGFSLAVREESRARYGQIGAGVVLGLYTSDATAVLPVGYGARPSRTTGSNAYQGIAHFLWTASLDEWVVQYRYPCASATGTCQGADFVDRDLWNRLHIGQTVNVRRSTDETMTARLDENPQRGLALVKTALAALLFALAGFVSGRLTLLPKRKYLQADAVVTSVERVRYGQDTRWKVRFAYFDVDGNAQDSADEVNDPSWKVGDDCYAIYRPQSPDVASLQRGQTGVRPESDQGLTPI